MPDAAVSASVKPFEAIPRASLFRILGRLLRGELSRYDIRAKPTDGLPVELEALH